MNISRHTFQRVLASARQKIADALLNSKAIRIDGGNFEMTWRRLRCHREHEWELEIPVRVSPRCSVSKADPLLVKMAFSRCHPLQRFHREIELFKIFNEAGKTQL
jgi:hypothetical protein